MTRGRQSATTTSAPACWSSTCWRGCWPPVTAPGDARRGRRGFRCRTAPAASTPRPRGRGPVRRRGPRTRGCRTRHVADVRNPTAPAWRRHPVRAGVRDDARGSRQTSGCGGRRGSYREPDAPLASFREGARRDGTASPLDCCRLLLRSRVPGPPSGVKIRVFTPPELFGPEPRPTEILGPLDQATCYSRTGTNGCHCLDDVSLLQRACSRSPRNNVRMPILVDVSLSSAPAPTGSAGASAPTRRWLSR